MTQQSRKSGLYKLFLATLLAVAVFGIFYSVVGGNYLSLHREVADRGRSPR